MPDGQGVITWEKIALGVLSIMISGLGVWLVDLKHEVTQVRRTQDQSTWILELIEELHTTSNTHDKDLTRLDYKLDQLGTLLAQVKQRQDTCHCLTPLP